MKKQAFGIFNVMNRRDFLEKGGKVAALAALLPERALHATHVNHVDELLSTSLVAEHPRLHFRQEQWNTLRKRIATDDVLQDWFRKLQISAHTMMSEPVAEYKLIGPRLLAQSRAALLRIETLGALYKLDGDKAKALRARAELMAVCSFPGWHPEHFLDTAEMTNAAALGYDWLYEVLTEEDRATVRKSIIAYGLRPGLDQYTKQVFWTLPHANNWGQVCNGGLTLGALAILNDGMHDPGGLAPEPEQMLKITTANVRNALTNYGPDGGWPEGPNYWLYATRYTCAMISGLESALGTDLGLSRMEGFSDTGTFRMALIGPTGESFNYADGPAKLELSPEMFWLARRFNKAIYNVSESKQVAASEPLIFHLLWGPAEEERREYAAAVYPPLDVRYRKINLACLRTSWTHPDAFFIGIKGGDNAGSHAHLDLGSFVFDALGVRWALDLGADDYALPGYFNSTQRWDYYRLRTEGHNTLTYGKNNQPLDAVAPLTEFASAPAQGSAAIDLTKAYQPDVTFVRRVVHLQRTPHVRCSIQDHIRSTGDRQLRWNMHTRASILLVEGGAILEQNGKRLKATLESPPGARFQLISASVPQPQGQQPDVHNLIIEVNASHGDNEVRVVFEAG